MPKTFFQKSWARYDAAYEIMRVTNDRIGQVLVLGSMAKSASEGRRHDLGQCECQVRQICLFCSIGHRMDFRNSKSSDGEICNAIAKNNSLFNYFSLMFFDLE